MTFGTALGRTIKEFHFAAGIIIAVIGTAVIMEKATGNTFLGPL